jgi:chromosome segregation ATPase
MINNLKILLISLGTVMFISPAVYLAVKYNIEKALNQQLSQSLHETLQEKESLQKHVAEIENKIKEQENKLKELSDVERINSSLQKKQQLVQDLNKKLTDKDKERIALQNTNVSLATRLENTGRELSQSMSELKLLKAGMANLEVGQAGTLQRKIEDLGRDSDSKGRDLTRLKEELVRLQMENQSLVENNKNLERSLKDAGTKQQTGAAVLVRGQGLSEAQTKELQGNVAQLKSTLEHKENQIKQLQVEVASLESLSSGSAGRNNREQQRVIDDLDSANRELKRKIADLQDNLDSARRDVSSLKARKDPPEAALYASTKDQLGRLSEILIKKEVELDSLKKESRQAQDRLADLESQLTKLKQELAVNKTNTEQLKELERQKISLDVRLNELQGTIVSKNELVESLQKNLGYLSAQLAKKEEEAKSIESKFSSVDATTKEEIEKQKARYDEINMLYNSLKMQVAQFSDALNQKGAELEQRGKESGSLKDEIARLQLRSENLEKELSDARERQRKTLDDLVAAVRLNTMLQEKMLGVSSTLETPKPVSEQQKKADELKRKIEVILEPQR